MDAFPVYSRAEKISDYCVHAIGVTSGLIGVAVLAVLAMQRGTPIVTAGLAIYGCALLAMLCCSALYNIVHHRSWKAWLRRIDHAVIFVMIAGSYTPFALVKIGGTWGTALLAIVWATATVGAALKLLAPKRLERLSTALYLVLGWTILIALKPLFESVSIPAIALLGIGGVLYTVGAGFYAWKRLPYHNTIWHVLVLCGAATHYAAVLHDVALPSIAAA